MIRENALSEFIKAISYFEKVLCTKIIFTDSLGDSYTFFLKVGHSTKDFINFLSDLNFTYCNLHASSEGLDGIIWLTKDTYLIRKENKNGYFWSPEYSMQISDDLK